MSKLFQSAQERDFAQFVKLIPKLPTWEFLGVSKILCVDIYTIDENGKSEPKPVDQVLEEIFDVFLALPKKKRREVLDVIKQARREVKAHGAGT